MIVSLSNSSFRMRMQSIKLILILNMERNKDARSVEKNTGSWKTKAQEATKYFEVLRWNQIQSCGTLVFFRSCWKSDDKGGNNCFHVSLIGCLLIISPLGSLERMNTSTAEHGDTVLTHTGTHSSISSTSSMPAKCNDYGNFSPLHSMGRYRPAVDAKQLIMLTS